MENRELVSMALKARTFAYTPYSGFQVGAALLCKDGTVYTGCNIENAAFGPTNCAERTAIFKAVSEGKREFSRIAIVGGPAGTKPAEFCPPCGVCRQVMMEFCEPEEFKIILGRMGEDGREEMAEYTLKELLPLGFSGSGVARKEQEESC